MDGYELGLKLGFAEGVADGEVDSEGECEELGEVVCGGQSDSQKGPPSSLFGSS